MSSRTQEEFVVVGAGAAGLMAARELARAGKTVTLLEARDRCGGRIDPLSVAEFGYPAEGGAEFVHGEAHHTRALMCEAGLSLVTSSGTGWRAANGGLSIDDRSMPHETEFRRGLSALKADLPVGEFLARHFGDPQYAALRRSVTRRVESYDAADPGRASTFALRDEWIGRGLGRQGRIAEGYGALIEFLVKECRRHGVTVRLGAVVSAIDADRETATVQCREGSCFTGRVAVLAVPLPLLRTIALPDQAQAIAAAAAADIGFGNVVKILLRFSRIWWATDAGRDLKDMSFLFSDAAVPTWWTQYPEQRPVLTGWLAGPRADAAALSATDIIEVAFGSLAQAFAVSPEWLTQMLVAFRAIDWNADPFARGAYSYATPSTSRVLAMLDHLDANVWFAGEAFYRGPEMGTVEAALTSGWQTARNILTKGCN